jgi:hypothetical protein
MGYDPVVHSLRDQAETKELIYNYVESGIPVILVVSLPNVGPGYHALTVVGHTYDPEHPGNAPPHDGSVRSTSDWCPFFVIHDDRIGPYLKLAVGPLDGRQPGRPTLLLDQDQWLIQPTRERVKSWYSEGTIDYAVAALPPRHHLRAQEAATKGREILERAYSIWSGNIEGLELPTQRVYRTYFTSSADFLRRFSTNAVSEAGPPLDIAHWYRGSSYSRYLWVTELSTIEAHGVEPSNLRIVADVTVDPTSAPKPLDFLTLHIPRVFARMPPGEIDAARSLSEAKVFDQDRPFAPMVRRGVRPV